MPESGDRQRELAEYLRDVRLIREAMLKADNQLRVPAWFFFAMAALISIAGVTHAWLVSASGTDLAHLLFVVWVPFVILAGVIEVLAWIKTGTRAGISWMSKPFGRFVATVSGTMIATFALGIVALFDGASTAGVVLLLASAALLAYSTYSPPASIWLAWIGLGPGVALLVRGVDSHAAVGVAGLYVVASFVVLGIAEHRHERSGERQSQNKGQESHE
jgi:hypothetical protein